MKELPARIVRNASGEFVFGGTNQASRAGSLGGASAQPAIAWLWISRLRSSVDLPPHTP